LITPSLVQQPLNSESSFNVLNNTVSWSFARLLTPDIAFQVNSGWIHNSASGFPTQAGFDQTSVEIKGLLYKNELHETLISASFGWGIGGSGSQRVGANAPDTIQPGIFFGRGFGDLPDNLSWLRPFAVTGAVSADLPTRGSAVNFDQNSATNQFGLAPGPVANTLFWGFAVEYSTLYLTNRFKPGQLPKDEPLHQWIPLVEFAFASPSGQKTAATMNPGVFYVEDVWQVSVEAIVPLNGEGGHGLGARGQVLLFLDDLLPKVFGKPLLSR
jgi:hypothetical protein